MTTVTQPSSAPTRKLSASLLGYVLGALIFAVVSAIWPALADVQIEGVGSLSIAFQIITAGVLGYWVKDRPNV